MQPEERIRQAVLRFEFCVKLMRHFESGRVSKNDFDIITPIRSPLGLTVFPANTFHSDAELVLGAQNVFSSALGVLAIALETALDEFGVKKDPQDLSPTGTLRSFVYQLRNAFAHDAMHPKWSVRGPFARAYDLAVIRKPLVVDLVALHGRSVALHQFGELEGLLAIQEAVFRWVADGSPN